MKLKKKICKNCEKTTYIFSKGECKTCANIRYGRKSIEAKKEQKRKVGDNRKYPNQNPIKNRSKHGQKVANEDSKFFKQIWKDRPHYSEVSGTYLGSDYNPCFFSHVLTKAAFPKARHWPENIILKTFEEHQEWEFGDRSTPEFKKKFAKVFKRYIQLTHEYYTR